MLAKSGRGEFLIAADAERAIGHFKGGDAESRHGADSEPSASDVIDFLLERQQGGCAMAGHTNAWATVRNKKSGYRVCSPPTISSS